MAAKKWITKAEINTILKTYSVQKNEFEEIRECCFLSRVVKGYMITISEEFFSRDRFGERTGRIHVLHTCQKGKRIFCDIWERDKEGKLYFKFRNPANVPLSDVYYIKELEEHIEEMKKAGRKLQEQLPKHNQRNAGRRKADEKWMESYLQWVTLYESQKSIKEIIKIMGISRTTHYRFKKAYEKNIV